MPELFALLAHGSAGDNVADSGSTVFGGQGMRYTVRHTTTYTYSSPVYLSHHRLHLRPCDVVGQTTHAHALSFTPTPATQVTGVDYFGNPFQIISLESEHEALSVAAESEIEVTSREDIDLDASSDWQAVARREWEPGGPAHKDIWQFAAPSRHARRLAAAAEFARPSFSQGRPILACVRDLTERIFDEFKFDPTATDVSTPVEHVLEKRRGVCQDFAHLQIACLRSMNLPARYVSGYIRTYPPEGQERLQGADASHAWLSVWAPETGWVDFDPTNNQIPKGDNVTIAYGRDYDDVSPISGVLLGGGDHAVAVGVDVVPADEADQKGNGRKNTRAAK